MVDNKLFNFSSLSISLFVLLYQILKYFCNKFVYFLLFNSFNIFPIFILNLLSLLYFSKIFNIYLFALRLKHFFIFIKKRFAFRCFSISLISFFVFLFNNFAFNLFQLFVMDLLSLYVLYTAWIFLIFFSIMLYFV